MNPDGTLKALKEALSATDRHVWNSAERVNRARQGFERISTAVAKAEMAYARSKAVLARIRVRDDPEPG